jgi:hypothetical protein
MPLVKSGRKEGSLNDGKLAGYISHSPEECKVLLSAHDRITGPTSLETKKKQ